MSGLLTPDIEEKVIGSAQILEIFKVSGAGKVAGSKITDGEINSTSDVRIIRDGTIIYTGKVSTIFREKPVKQVNVGQECGITLKDYMDFQKNDINRHLMLHLQKGQFKWQIKLVNHYRKGN